MAIAAQETREDKVKWLMRPLNCAYTTATSFAIIAGLAWHDGKADPESLALIAVSGLLITSGLLIWGIRRLTQVTRGRY